MMHNEPFKKSDAIHNQLFSKMLIESPISNVIWSKTKTVLMKHFCLCKVASNSCLRLTQSATCQHDLTLSRMKGGPKMCSKQQINLL